MVQVWFKEDVVIVKALKLLAKVFSRPPSVGEFITCLGGIGFIILAICGEDHTLPKSIIQLSTYGRSPEFWYTLGLLGLLLQLGGLIFNHKWIRWFGAILVASWWLNIALALIYLSGMVSWVSIYLSLVCLNAYVVAHLLWKE
jgi:hypothetical protein